MERRVPLATRDRQATWAPRCEGYNPVAYAIFVLDRAVSKDTLVGRVLNAGCRGTVCLRIQC